MDQSGTEEFNELLQGYLRESLTPEELSVFFELAAKPENSKLVAELYCKDLEIGLPDLSNIAEKQEAWTRLHVKMEKDPRPVFHLRTALRWVAIVVCFLGATAAVYFFNRSKNNSEISNIRPPIKIPKWLTEDHIGATLILAGGDSVILNSQDKGTIAKQDGMEVIQSGGVVSYAGKSQTQMYNEIHTGKGKIWRAVLPDQTVVWLNENSSIKYPLLFASEARSVEMNGEIYFEVAHHAEYPFRIKSGRESVEDIGTSFNIRSFADDSASTTSLVEGSVRVILNNQQATLNAGQQSVVTSGKNEILIVKNANISGALAWKNGFFYFQNAGLRSVMKELSGWYQVDVIYTGREGNELFSGQIDKTLSLADVLQGLQQPGVKFSLEKNQITVIQQ
ncbi:MAG TPA: FecR domain-containing protein [Puia sp.]|nr:FecR domain-containing protein [Puia sp.]